MGLVAGMIGLAGGVLGCSSVGAGSGTPRPSSTSASAQGALAACPASALALSVDVQQAGVAAGTTYYPVDVTNTGTTACTLSGYLSVWAVTAPDAAGRRLGAAAQQDQSFSPVEVRLAPGGHAHAWLEVGSAANYPAAACAVTTAHGLRVSPPGSDAAGYVGFSVEVCTAASAQQLSVMPVRAGLGSRGSTP